MKQSPVEVQAMEALARTTAILGGKWTVEIVNALLSGPHRFGELRKALDGMSPKMQSLRLRELERRGFITRTVHLEVPPCVEYALTDQGRTLAPILAAMVAWGEAHQETKP